MVATSCDLNTPRCTTKAQQVPLHRSRGGVFVDHRHPGTPVISCFYKHITLNGWSFTSAQAFHTHTHPAVGRVFSVQMRWRLGWRGAWGWDESELRWNEKILNWDTRRGTQKKRERANTNTNTPGPERANPERAREKKSGGRRTRNKTSGGGEDRSAWTNLTQRNLRLYLGTHWTQPTWGGKNAWNRGPNGELVDEERWNNNS